MSSWLFLAGMVAASPAASPAHAPLTIISHRGMSNKTPENKIAAFRNMAGRGVPTIKLDVRPTHDRQLMVIHRTPTPVERVRLAKHCMPRYSRPDRPG